MERINIEDLKNEVKIKSTAYGELHAAYAGIYVSGPMSYKETMLYKEKYHRIHIEAEGYMFLDIKNEIPLKRQFIAWHERIYDPLVPALKELTEGSFSAKISGITHLPLLLLPGDTIFITIFNKRPFDVLLKREW
jgi:hypothetical protein